MGCASCGRANPSDARFCGGCGTPLAPSCPSCGRKRERDAPFCIGCGASLADPLSGEPVARKVVTIVFADLIGSVSLHERLDPEAVARLMDRYHRAVRAQIELHRGTVMELLGDGVMCAFGVPRAAEDDALRAVRAAVGVQRAFREFVREHQGVAAGIGLRVAINTGEVVVSDDYAAGVGDPLNVAARLQHEAQDGDVLISESTQRLVAEQVTLAAVGRFALKGRAEPVTAYRVVSLERPAGAAAIAFVGREEELRRITSVFEAASAAPATRLAVVLGSPGLGKSRLLAELAHRLGEGASVLIASCNASGGATFAPLAEALRAQLGVEDGDGGDALRVAIDAILPGEEAERARIAAGIGALLAGAPASPEETFFVVRRLLGALAAVRPVVLAIDDLQWAEPLLLDLTEHLVQWGAGVPLLVLAAARPELRDLRSSLSAVGGLVAEVVTLAGLDAGAATRLAANVIGAEELPAALAGRVLAASEGNPLFVGELVRMLVLDGVLKREGNRWIAGVALADLEMPPTIQALLAARLERLRPEERLVLERAAVVGRHFSRAAVLHLLPADAHADLDARLESLRRSELIESDSGWLLGEPTLRFHHLLIRDAAYRRLLRHTRAELHGRFADWLEKGAGESAPHDETIGWHLEQAHEHLRELGPLDASARAIGERAARYLAAAGRRALARDDLPPAASLLGRALARLDPGDPARAELALDWCEALLSTGDVGPAASAIAELGRFIGDSDRLRAWHACFSGQLSVLTDPQALRASAEAVEAAAVTLTAAGDAAGEAKAHAVHALVLAQLGKIGACEAALDKALAAARRAHDRRRANAVLAGAPVAALWGPSPVTRASGRCLDVVRVLRITQGAPAVEAVALRCQAVLETLRGRAEAARRMIASSRSMVEELGITQRVLEADLFAGMIELLEGDAAAAEGFLRTAYDGLRAQGLGIDAAQAAALLARALLAQGRVGEAEAASVESETLAGDSFKAAIAWRGVRAEVLAARGEHATALELARAAVDIAAATDDLLDHADARQALAVALRAGGWEPEADAEQRRAIELWEAKGATLLVERARSAAKPVVQGERASAKRTLPARLERRRVRDNAATESGARLCAAAIARDMETIAALCADELQVVHHPTGSLIDRDAGLNRWRMLTRAEGLSISLETLATIGDSLALGRDLTSFDRLSQDELSFGASQSSYLNLLEVNERGQSVRVEIFADDRLGDAIARLYERYAEGLPEGGERSRAVATARTVAAVLGPEARQDPDVYAAAISPAIAFVDHRPLGLGSARGAGTFLRGLRSLLEVAAVSALRVDDILELGSDSLLVRQTNFGTGRAGGGAYERHFLGLWVFGDDGLLTRLEWFASDRVDEALARFDVLTEARFDGVARSAAKAARRVGANAATASMARMTAAVAARDVDAASAALADRVEHIDHALGAVYDREGELAMFRAGIKARDLILVHEPVAVLGDSLALSHRLWSASGGAGRTFDVGAYEREAFILIEADQQERMRGVEVFALDHLDDAVTRLYERYAEGLPEGGERTRATVAARSVAAALGPFDIDRYNTAHAPDIEYVDHRTQGIGSLTGPPAVAKWFRSLLELAEGIVNRIGDILGLRSDALLVRWVNSGTERASGGAYERHFLWLGALGADGLLARIEVFESDRETEALARFDELAAPPRKPTRRVLPNAATANAARFDAAVAARDAGALETLLADPVTSLDHTTGFEYDRQGALQIWRLTLDAQTTSFRNEPLATLGDSLALCGVSITASGSTGMFADVGVLRWEHLVLIDVDAQGRCRRAEVFRCDSLGQAVARLYESHAELLPDGPERTRAAVTARSIGVLLGPFDLARFATGIAPDLEVTDHRRIGLEPTHGAEAWLRGLDALVDLADDIANRIDDVLALRSNAFLVRFSNSGTQRVGGGAYERKFLHLGVIGPDGHLARIDLFEPDDNVAALALFDGLPDEAPDPRFANAAWRAAKRYVHGMMARDWEAVVAVHAATFSLDDRRAIVGVVVSGEDAVANLRVILAARSLRIEATLLATRGERLVLRRVRMSGEFGAGGPVEYDYLQVTEIDTDHRITGTVMFDPDDLDSAFAELDARYHAGEASPHPRVAAGMREFSRAFAQRDWDALAQRCTPDLAVHDRRLIGWESLDGPAAYVRALQSIVELAPDTKLRLDHVTLCGRGYLVVSVWEGTREGGAFEAPSLMVAELDADGRIRRFDQYDLERLETAHARFEALCADLGTGV